MKKYYQKSVSERRDTAIALKDSIQCLDGSSMVVKIEISLKYDKSNLYGVISDGIFKCSLTRIKTDSIGTPKLFSRIEKTENINMKDLELTENWDMCTIKKEWIEPETNEKISLDMILKEDNRHSTKSEILNIGNEKRIEEEIESVSSFMIVTGTINGQTFSEHAKCNFKMEYKKQRVSVSGNAFYLQ